MMKSSLSTRKMHEILQNKPYKILYLDVGDIAGSLEVIKKERADENGVELWFPLMVSYIEASPLWADARALGQRGIAEAPGKKRAIRAETD